MTRKPPAPQKNSGGPTSENCPIAPLQLPEAFAPSLVSWFRAHGRDYPWRRTDDPYEILIAEFMLQRTGVTQVMNVYPSFIERYPTVQALARAGEEELADLMRPLGRVGRQPVVKALAAALVEAHEGSVPDDLILLDALPGIGQYSARAVMCLAFNRPYVLLDPNSYRVLSRSCGLRSGKARMHTDRVLIGMLDQLVPQDDCRSFNLALLDLGSTICVNRSPRHDECPLVDLCQAVRAMP